MGDYKVPHPARGFITNRGQTLSDFAREIGYSPQTLGRVLRGSVASWPELRRRVAEALNRPETELFLDERLALVERTTQECDRQGVPVTLTDPAALASVGAVLRPRKAS